MSQEAVEIKTCELCGRLFVRPSVPQVQTDAEGKIGYAPKQRECLPCQRNPITEEAERGERTFRVMQGVKF